MTRLPLARHGLRALAVVAALALPTAAMADCPNRVADSIVKDAYDDGVIQGTYPKACYREALSVIPQDVKVYSPATVEAIRAKLNENPAAPKDPTLPASPPTQASTDPERILNSADPVPEQDGGTTATEAATLPDAPASGTSDGPLTKAIDFGRSDDPDNVPVPVIVLGVLAILLVLGGGASVLVRRRLEQRDRLF